MVTELPPMTKLLRHRARASTLVVVLAVACALTVVVGLIKWKDSLSTLLGVEAYKQLFQFLLITVLGGVVTTTLAEAKRAEERRTTHRTHVLSFYANVLLQYNKSKKLRRLLRLLISRRASLESNEVQRHYNELMLQLEDVQLEFESFRRQATVQGISLSRDARIIDHFNGIQIYLRQVVREYEEDRWLSPTSDCALEHPQLDDFVAEFGPVENYLSRVAIPFEEIEAALLLEIEQFS
jgi:hypothetical protein